MWQLVKMVENDLFVNVIKKVFSPKRDERFLFIYDEPTDYIKDNDAWKKRRKIVFDWANKIENNFDIIDKVDILSFDALGIPNKILNDDILNNFKEYNILVAFTEFSITSSLVKVVRSNKDFIRAASLPLLDSKTIETLLISDYDYIKKYSSKIKDILDDAVKAHIFFSTKDELIVDLRNRTAGVDDGDCTKPGCIINLPSGEGFIAPYEAYSDELDEFGKSFTEGILPINFNNEIIKAHIKNNVIDSFSGSDESVERICSYFDEGINRRNIAELGIGCNPQAYVIGNVIQDEKVGLHIAYGNSDHIGGKVKSDIHYDLVFAKNCPVGAVKVEIYLENEEFTLIDSSDLNLNLLDTF